MLRICFNSEKVTQLKTLMTWKVLETYNACVLQLALSKTNCEDALSICNGEPILAEISKNITSVYKEQDSRDYMMKT